MPPILVDLEDAAGTKIGPGPISALSWRRTRKLDLGGDVAFDTPVTNPRSALLALRLYAHCYGPLAGSRTDLGLGIIDRLGTDVDGRLVSLSGKDLFRELSLRTVGTLELKEAGETPMTLDDALDAILTACNAQPGEAWALDRATYASAGDITNLSTTIANVTNISNWTGREGYPIYGADIPAGATVVSVGADSLVISAAATATATVALARIQVFYAFAGESVLEALAKVASLTGTHFRLGDGREIVWLFNVQPKSGIRAVIGVDPVAAESNPDICLITGLTYIQDSSDLISRIYPYGSGTGADKLDLSGTTRTAPDGYVLDTADNYIERTAAESTYGYGARYRTWSDISPTVPDTDPDYADALENAQNTLFDTAIEYLRSHSYAQESFKLEVTKLDQEILPGETIRVIYTGYVDGYRWINVNRDFVVLESTTEITSGGIHTPSLTVATIDRWPVSDLELLVALVRQVQQAQARGQ